MAKSDERKAKAQELKVQQQAAERRERNIRIIGTLSVVAIIAGIFAVVLTQRDSAAPSNDGTIPALVNQDDGSYTYNPDTTATDTMELWEDFQCPGCGAFESTFGAKVTQMADENLVKLIVHPAAFLDRNFAGQYSTKATSAWGCALEIDEAKAWKFRAAVFANQNPTEGEGWTNDQFLQLAQASGFTTDDLPTLTQCYQDVAHAKWAAVSTQTFYDSGIKSTPTIWLNGEAITDDAALSNGPDGLYNWVKDKIGK